MSLEFVLDDPPVLVVNKPADVAVQGPEGRDSVAHRVRQYLKDRFGKAGNVYLGMPHRLDKPVTGCLLVARNSKAARRLAEQFKDRLVGKEYLALVATAPRDAEGTLADWMRQDEAERKAVRLEAFVPGAQEATTNYRVVATGDGGTLLRLKPVTGRFHQLRAQLAWRGWPVVGDETYGAPAARGRLMLHAAALTFLHPVRYDQVRAVAPLPDGWPEWCRSAAEAAVAAAASPEDSTSVTGGPCAPGSAS